MLVLATIRYIVKNYHVCLFAVQKQYLMVTQGYPTNPSKLSEVIDARNPKKACKPLSALDIGNQWYAGYGGVIDGVIVVCGGSLTDSKDCFAYKNNNWTPLATLKQGKVPTKVL